MKRHEAPASIFNVEFNEKSAIAKEYRNSLEAAREEHLSLAFEVWALDVIHQERRPFVIVGVIVTAIITVAPWFLFRWMLDGYVTLPFSAWHFGSTLILGLATLYWFAYKVSHPHMRRVLNFIASEENRLGVKPRS